MKLEDLRPGEEVSIIIRRHWIVFTILGFYFLGGLVLTIILFFIFGFNLPIVLLLIIFWMTFSIFLYIEWLNHELDMYIITNNRIVFLEQKSLFNITKTECNLGQVQEVNSSAKGLFANLLGYGLLSIVTAGSTKNLEMGFTPKSSQNTRRILNIVDQYRDKHSFKQKEEN